MSLRKKVLVFITLSNIITISAIYLITSFILRRDFTNLENHTIERNVSRGAKALDSLVAQVRILCADYAGWDDTYVFMKDRNSKYINTNLVDETFLSSKLNLILIINSSGEMLYGKYYDLQAKKEIDLPKDINTLTSLNTKIMEINDPLKGLSGVTNLESGTMLTAAYPIVTSEKKGPVLGTLIMGRRFSTEQIQEIRDITSLDISFTQVSDPTRVLPDSRVVKITELNRFKSQGESRINDINGNPALIETVSIDREITGQLDHGVLYLIAALGILGVSNLIIAIGFIQSVMLAPLSSLVTDVTKISQSGKFSLRVRSRKTDEIGTLAKEVNNMLSSLEQTTKSIIELNKELKKQRANIEAEIDKRTHQLKEEQARFIASINSFPDAFVISDTNGQILLNNKALNKTVEVDKAHWSIDELSEIFKDVVDIKRNIALSQKEGKSLLLSGLAFNKKFLKIYIAPVFLTAENSTIGTVMLISDITESVLTERSKDEFLSIASHELRTPLSAIKGNSELLRSYYEDRIKDESFKEIVSDIHTASVSLIDIVNTFLTTSRLEQGRIEFKYEDISIKQLVAEIVNKYRAIAEKKEIKIQFTDIAPFELYIRADKDRVAEVLTNLIGNAIKYTEKGTITVVIDSADNFAKISVIDSGKGIPLKQQALLFKKFQQASNNIYTRDITQGTGLGLYIAKLMVESMGGEIYLENSAENIGSVFVFKLPRSIKNK